MTIPSSDLENRFKFHPADTEEKQKKHEEIRSDCLVLAQFINETVPDGEEKETAIKRLEEVMMWSNAGIARH